MKPRLVFAALLLAAGPACFGAAAAPAATRFTVTVAHDLAEARPAEVITLPWKELLARLPAVRPNHVRVRDAAGREVPSQMINFQPEVRTGAYDELIFQHSFAAGERTARFTVELVDEPVPPYPMLTYARHVPERFDDFAWENDRVAHRMYGQGLDTPAATNSRMISSGIDVWTKRVSWPIVDRWYLRGHDQYHIDNGEGLDFYTVSTGRGVGGLGIWTAGRLMVSHNWKDAKVLANGPIRTVFELGYAPWNAGNGVMVSEVKRFIVDAGRYLDRVESTFTFTGPAELTVGLGLSKHAAPAVTGKLTRHDAAGFMALWEKYSKPEEAELGTAVLLAASGTAPVAAEDNQNHLMLVPARSGQPLAYYAGAGWSRTGDFKAEADWNNYLEAFSRRLRSPVRVTYAP
jgi:hypothetical protein